tara:strand:- start:358 stop:705 length:348 start_codon:yes stop_codon:yes gene_type:complete
MSIVVEVTKDDIRKGVRKDACQCPIALALRRAVVADLEDAIEVDIDDIGASVDYDELRVWAGSDFEDHMLDGRTYSDDYSLFPVDEEDWYGIKNFIENFDLGNDVEPFVVELTYN